MQVELSGDQSNLVKALMASGRFNSAEEVIEKALVSLNAQEVEYDETVGDVKASLEDENAGRVGSIHAAADRIREHNGLSRLS